MRAYKQHKIDGNQTAVVKHLRERGCSVQSLAEVGKGCPDLLVGYQGRTFLIELKNGDKPPSGRALTPDEIGWHDRWSGARVLVTYSAEDTWAAILGAARIHG